jgi:hypothetical protein
MNNELPIAIINRWLEMIEKKELYSLSEENIVYMLTKIKEVLIEENQK